MILLNQNARRKCVKNTEKFEDMEQIADSKVRVHVNLRMKLNHMNK